jgi:glycosyltransferase involved in cell wall biosynthesis
VLSDRAVAQPSQDHLPISVFVIAKNEADRIGRTILSVRDFADEIIVVDSGSTDNTVELSKSLGAKTYFNEWPGYGKQKIFGESLCRNNWVFNLDADEELTPEARAEIRALFANGEPAVSGIAMRFVNVLPFEKKPNFFATYNFYIRLYRKDIAGFQDSPVHDAVTMPAGQKTITLRNIALHRSHRNYAHTIDKINFYSSMQAEDNFAKGRNFGLLRLLFTFPVDFLKAYFMRRYIWYGLEGVTQSTIYAFARFLRVAKTRERFMSEKFRE